MQAMLSRAPAQFRPLDVEGRHELLLQLAPGLQQRMHPRDFCTQRMAR